MLLEQGVQDGFLHVHPIFGLVEDDGLRAVENFGRNFEAAVRRKTVHENSFGRGHGHEFGVDLIGREDRSARFGFRLEAHTGPSVGIDGLRARDGFARVGEEFDFGFGFAGDAFGIGDNFGKRLIVGRRGDLHVHAETRGEIQERVADVVAVAHVGEFEAAKLAEFFFEREEIGERLAGMEFVGKGVDDGNAGIGGHFVENFLRVDTSHDAVDPAVEIAGDVSDGFAGAERSGGLRMVEEDHAAAHALDADVEGDTGAQRGLFENQSDEFAGEGRGIAARTSLHVSGEQEQVARVRGTPLGAGEQIVRQRNR